MQDEVVVEALLVAVMLLLSVPMWMLRLESNLTTGSVRSASVLTAGAIKSFGRR